MKKSLITLLLMFLGVASVFSQQQITGKVVEFGTDDPLPGVNVVIKGTLTGTVTDIDGGFAINASPENVLVFTFVGYLNEEVRVGTATTMTVSLMPDIKLLGEFVVVGYGTQRKSDLTGSVAAINAEDLQNVPSVGIDRALQGRVAGVAVNASGGAPGGPTSIRIRGMGSIFSGNDPLFVVDGIPLAPGTQIENIVNSSDVERIDVLKDASAAAIYGSRGSNGVIIITTKRGKAGEPAISFNSYSGFRNPVNEPRLADLEEHVRLAKISHQNANAALDPIFLRREPGEWGPGTNWWNEILRDGGGRLQNHEFSIAGGSDNFSYSSSIGYHNDKGIIKHSEYERITFSLNTDYRFLDYFQLGSNLRYSNTERRGINENDTEGGTIAKAFQISPLDTVWKTYEEMVAIANAGYDTSKVWNHYAAANRTSNTNVVRELDQNNAYTKHNFVFGNLFLQGEFFEHLTIRSELGIDVRRMDFYNYSPVFFSSANEQNEISTVTRNYGFTNNWTNNNNITWAQRLGRHNYSVMAGFSREYFSYESLGAEGRETPSDDPSFWYISSTTGDRFSTGRASRNTLESYMARVFYGYDDRYLVTMNIRRDGTSKFSRVNNNRWGTFPSVSAGWNLHNERFFQALDLNWVTTIKFRGSWGQIGNQNIPNNAYIPVLVSTFTDRYAFGRDEVFETAFRPGNNANPQVRWETQETTNIGVDMELFRGKFQFTSDYFIRNTIDNLLVLPQPIYSGTPNYWANVGKIQNRGLEFDARYMNYDGEFKYSIGGNVAFLENKVLDLGLGNENIYSTSRRVGSISNTMVGHPIGMFWGYQILGVFQTEEDVQNHVNENGVLLQPRATPGDFIFADIAGAFDEDGNPIPDGRINAEDRTFIGNPHPKAVYGASLNMAYRGFDLNIFLQGQYGNDIFMYQKYWNNQGYRDGFNQVSGLEEISWNGPGSTNSHPIINHRKADNQRLSEWWLSDGSYMRVKNITLAYNLPNNILNNIRVKGAQIYITGENLFTFTKYEGLDPEIGAAGATSLEIGVDWYVYPASRTFLAGVRLSL
jgi:TonB-dependent starch-binding outer membrane protein SusC